MIEGTIYCKFTKYYWAASTAQDGSVFRSQMRTHNSARQAADEVLEQIRRKTGRTDLTLHRRTAKIYDIANQEGGAK